MRKPGAMKSARFQLRATLSCFFLIAWGFQGSILGNRLDFAPLGPYGGDVRSLAVHPQRPDVFFLGTADGQIYVSRNAGRSWSLLVPGLNRRELVVDNLAFDPKDPDTVYAATWELKGDRGWLFRSRDNGESWEKIDLGRFNSTIRALAIAPTDPSVVAVGISEGVLVTQDGGRSWDRISRGYRSLHNVESLAFDPLDSQSLYVGTWHLSWKTPNLGKKWLAIHDGMMKDSDVFDLLIQPENPQTLYASACSGIYKSTNGGLRWTKLKNGLTTAARRTRALHMDPADPNRIYAGTTKGLFVSSSAGSRWRRLFSGVVINAVVVHPGNKDIVLVGADDAGILRSEDGGTTFSASNEGFIHRQIGALSADPHREDAFYVSAVLDLQHGGFFVLESGRTDWSPYNEGLDKDSVTSVRAILPSRKSKAVYLGTRSGVFVGVPLDEPWQPIEATNRLVLSDLAFSDRREKAMFLASETGVFYLDLPDERLEKREIPSYQGKIHTVHFDVTGSLLFAGTDEGLFRSSNGGKTWSKRAHGLPVAAVNEIRRIGARLICATRQGLFLSEDSGKTWTPPPGIDPIDVVAIGSSPNQNANQVFAVDALVGHLFGSWDGGQTWRMASLGRSFPKITELLLDSSGNLLAGTVSEGVQQIATDAAFEGTN